MLDNKDKKILGSFQALGFDIQKVVNIYPKIFQPVLPLSSTGISARNFAHWKKEGLIDFESMSERAWVRLDLFQFIWLLIIKTLRDYGLSFPDIRTVKEALFLNLIEEVRQVDSATLLKKFKQGGMETKQAKHLVEILSYAIDKVAELPKEYALLTNKLGNSIFGLFLENSEAYFCLSKVKGGISVELVSDSMNPEQKVDIKSYIKSSALFISLRQLVEEFATRPESEIFAKAYGLIGGTEVEALKIIESGDYSDLLLRTEGSSEPKTIKRPDNIREREKMVQMLKTRFIFNDYQELRVMKGKDIKLILRNKWS